jgi:hypothetical protein
MNHQQKMVQFLCKILMVIVHIHQMIQKPVSAEKMLTAYQASKRHVLDHPFIIQEVLGAVG